VLGTRTRRWSGPNSTDCADEKDGVMTVQLTYNNRNLSGDGSLEPANAGLSK